MVTAASIAGALVLGVSQASAATLTFTATLNGLSEFPSNASPGTGTASVSWDTVTHMMTVNVSFSGLVSTTTASHIHCCVSPQSATPTAIVATPTPSFPNFPLGVMSGTYLQTFDMTLASSYNAAFVTANGGTVAGAEATLLAGLQAGEAYLNIHTTTYPGGEIRGFLTAPSAVQLMRFTASKAGKDVRLRWRTASEAGTIGFNVFRGRAGARIRVSHRLIPARSSVSGGSYSWLDRRPGSSSRYWLQIVDADGSTSWYGPARVH
jgi:hypothetical protein